MSQVVIDDVTVHYGTETNKPLVAVQNLSLSVPKNVFVSIVGPSGCGKSTLLKAVFGLIDPTAGSILIDGIKVVGPGLERAMVFQEFGLLPWRTVQKNIEFGLELRGADKAQREKKAAELIDLVGLKGFERSYPHQLSGGMRQRVGIARALAVEPKVLLMDEPFANVDVQTKILLQDELLKLWNRSPTTVIFVTHDIEEAIFVGDVVFVITARPGRVKEVINVDIERPRDYEVRMSERFAELRKHIWDSLKEEFKPQ